MAHFTSFDSRRLSRVCVGGFRPIPAGVFRQATIEAVDPEILVDMERGIRAEIAQTSGVSGFTNLEDGTGPCRVWLSHWVDTGAEHPATGGGSSLLLGSNHSGRVIPRSTYVHVPDAEDHGTRADITDGLVMGAHRGHTTDYEGGDQASQRAICLQISASDLVYLYRVCGIFAAVLR